MVPIRAVNFLKRQLLDFAVSEKALVSSATCISIRKDHPRTAPNAGIYSEYAQCVAICSPFVKHRIARVEIEVRILVEEKTPGNLLIVPHRLHFFHRDRLVFQLCRFLVAKNAMQHHRWHICYRHNAVEFRDLTHRFVCWRKPIYSVSA